MMIKNAQSDSRAFRGPKAGKSRFFSGQTRKKFPQITRVNTVNLAIDSVVK
jgi:hypothetical protein